MQHLESIVIHWTRQIKDVVNNHDNALSAEILGPLEEIEVGQRMSVVEGLKQDKTGVVCMVRPQPQQRAYRTDGRKRHWAARQGTRHKDETSQR